MVLYVARLLRNVKHDCTHAILWVKFITIRVRVRAGIEVSYRDIGFGRDSALRSEIMGSEWALVNFLRHGRLERALSLLQESMSLWADDALKQPATTTAP